MSTKNVDLKDKLNDLVSLEMQEYYDGAWIDSSDARYQLIGFSSNVIDLCIEILKENGFNESAYFLEKNKNS